MLIFILKLTLFLLFAGVFPSLSLVFFLARDKNHFDLIDKCIVALLLSPLVLVLVSFSEEALGIPQSGFVISGNLLLLFLANIYLIIKYYRGEKVFSFHFSWGKLIFFFLFLTVIMFRVLPTESLLTPLLHDPVAHSQWLKELNLNHFTTRDSWYPQGLEYYLNYFSVYFDVSYPKIILTWTNLFSAMFPIGFFYMGMLLVKKPGKNYLLYPMVLFTLAVVSRIPADLYFTAGKNSLIFLLSSTPIILYAVYIARRKLEYLISTLLVSAAIIIHFPTGFSLLVIFGSMTLLKLTSWRRWRLTIDYKILRDLLPGAAALIVYMLIIVYRVLPIYRAHPPDNDKAIVGSQLFIEKFGVVKYVTDSFYLREVSLIGTFAILLFIAALAVFLFADSNRTQRRFTGHLLFSFSVLYVIGALALYLPDKAQGIYLSWQIQYFFVPVLIAVVAWLIIYSLNRWDLAGSAFFYSLSVLFLAALVIYSGTNQYEQYLEKQDGLNTTNAEDLEAFSYINNEIHDNRKFLIQMNNGLDIVMGSDSGVWIPTFTDKDVEVDFADYANPQSYEVYDQYIAVARDGNNNAAIKKLYCDYDVGYVFFGNRQVFSDNMQKEVLDASDHFRKIFDNGASIYMIEAPECS